MPMLGLVHAVQYGTHQIDVPTVYSGQHAVRVPAANRSRIAIQATAPATIKWGLPTAVLCQHIDEIQGRAGSTDSWEADRITVGSYNPCTLRVDGGGVTMDLELTKLHVAACGVQEACDKQSFSK